MVVQYFITMSRRLKKSMTGTSRDLLEALEKLKTITPEGTLLKAVLKKQLELEDRIRKIENRFGMG